MKRLLPVIVLITILPTCILVGAAIYVGNQFLIAQGYASEPASPIPGNSKNETVGLATSSADEEWIQLFDGKSFNGWEGNKDFFRIDDGSIVAGNLKKAIPRNEFLCTKKTFTDFELRLQAKLIGEGKNAGIQFRSKRIPNHHEMIGFQCDMGQMNEHSIWGFLYDESRRRKFLAQVEPEKIDKHTKVGKWNDFVIRCEGNRIQIWVNGFQTVDYQEKDEKIDRSGVIGLQIHSGAPAEAWYRNIKIKTLN